MKTTSRHKLQHISTGIVTLVMTLLGEFFAHLGLIGVGFGTYLQYNLKNESYEMNFMSYILLVTLIFVLFLQDYSLVIGFMTLLELIILLNHFINPSYHFVQLFEKYYFSLLACSLCSFVSQKQKTSTSKYPPFTRFAVIFIQMQVLLLATHVDINFISFCLSFILAFFIHRTEISLSGFEFIVFYWSIFMTSDWIMKALSTSNLREIGSLELVNLIGSCGLLSVVFIGIILTIAVRIGQFMSPPSFILHGIIFFITFFLCVVFGMLPIMENILSLQKNDPNTHHFPLIWIFYFLNHSSHSRWFICLYWITLLAVSIPLGYYLTVSYSKIIPQICARKYFHFLACLMFAPVVEYDLEFMSLAFAVAICALLCLEYVRDLGNLIALTHIELLVGCAIPVWIWSYLQSSFPLIHLSYPSLRLLPHLGWITVGVGDSVAAIVGKYCGRHKWITQNSTFRTHFAPTVQKRTIQGSLGCFLSMGISSYVLLWITSMDSPEPKTLFFSDEFTTVLKSLFWATIVETFTSHADNVLMPLCTSLIFLALTSTSPSSSTTVVV